MLEPNDPTLSRALKAVRVYADLMTTLDRHRGQAQQVVKVEHVHVAPGAQAIVGAVATTEGGNGGRDGTKKP